MYDRAKNRTNLWVELAPKCETVTDYKWSRTYLLVAQIKNTSVLVLEVLRKIRWVESSRFDGKNIPFCSSDSLFIYAVQESLLL